MPGSYYSWSCSATYSYTASYRVISMAMNISKGTWTGINAYSTTDIDEDATDNNCVLTMATHAGSYSDNGTWEWSADKKQFILNYTSGTPDTYDIIELKEKEMKLKSVIGGTITEMTLTQ